MISSGFFVFTLA